MILTIIPTILFCLILKIKHFYRVLLSGLFYIVHFILSALLEHTIFNIHYNLIDKIGYNKITDFTHIISEFSAILFVILTSVIMYIIYKKQNKKLIYYTIKFFVLIILYYLLNFISGLIYFKMIDIFEYGSIITNIIYKICQILDFGILLYVLFYKKK